MKKLNYEELKELMGASSFAKGYRPNLDSAKSMLQGLGLEADDADIEIVLKETNQEIDEFEIMFDKLFTEDGDINVEGFKEVISNMVEDMEGE